MRVCSKVFFVSLLLLSCSHIGVSQILDDTTELVYGPYTTYFEKLENIKYNLPGMRKIDTLIGDLHQFDWITRNDYKYKDLGNVGTSMFPVFYEPPEVVGSRPGFESFEPYYFSEEDVQLFDTKSPYTYIRADLGGGRRSVTNVKHARNINPYWNAGFRFRRISAEKQVASSGRNDRQTVSTAYFLHSHYKSPNEKYAIAGAVMRTNHEVQESGGIDSSNFTFGDTEYFLEEADVNLTEAENNDLNLNFFLYNEYKWKPQLQFYYHWQQTGTRYFFRDENLNTDGDFFDKILINPDSTTNKARFRQSIHEPGIKGDQGGLFYNFYIKLRQVSYLHQYLPEDFSQLEQYGGFNLRFDFDTLSNHALNVKGEYLIGGEYELKALYRNKFFKGEYQRYRYKPTILQTNYFGNHNEWRNSFNSTNADIIKGQIDLRYKGQRLSPKLSITNVNNNVYFDEDGQPEQAGGNAQIFSPGLELDLDILKVFHWENELIYTELLGDDEAVDVFRIPNLFLNSRIYYGNELFDRTINLQAGVQLHYKSSHFAQSYDPTIRQLYLQDSFEVPAHWIADLFVNFRIDHVAVYVRYEYLNQGDNSGYFMYPTYIGQGQAFDLGVSWIFFD